MSTKDLKWLSACELLAPVFSTCGKRKYFSIITSREGRVLSTGYNGGPSGMRHCEDGGCPRLAEGSKPGSDYSNCIAIHAEVNALLFSDVGLRADGTLYVNGQPCFDCAKKIANSGVERVVHIRDASYGDLEQKVAEFLRNVGIDVVVYDRDNLNPLTELVAS